MPPLLRCSYLLLPFRGFHKWTSVSSGILKALKGRKGKTEKNKKQKTKQIELILFENFIMSCSKLKKVWLKLTQVKTRCRYKTKIWLGQNILLRQYIIFSCLFKVTKTSALQLLFRCACVKHVCARSRDMSMATKQNKFLLKKSEHFSQLAFARFLLKAFWLNIYISPYNKDVNCAQPH